MREDRWSRWLYAGFRVDHVKGLKECLKLEERLEMDFLDDELGRVVCCGATRVENKWKYNLPGGRVDLYFIGGFSEELGLEFALIVPADEIDEGTLTLTKKDVEKGKYAEYDLVGKRK